MILLAVIQLGEEAYGVPISRELERTAAASVSVGSVYAALERLETKGPGHFHSRRSHPGARRQGQALFPSHRTGLRQVQETRRVLSKLWRALPELKENAYEPR